MFMRNIQETTIDSSSSTNLINLTEFWRFRELFYILTWKDIKVRYKQTVLGVLWVVIQPLVNMVVFTVFFGNFARIPSGDLPYSVFVILGLVYWGLFSSGLSRASSSFIDNGNLVKKVYFPREILTFSTIVTGLVDFAISLLIMFAVMLYFGIFGNMVFYLSLFFGLLITLISSAGLGLLLASINIKYRDVRYIIPFFLQLLIFITPVIYPLSLVRPSLQSLLSVNPMTGVIDSLRASLSSGHISSLTPLLLASITSLFILYIGLVYFRKTERYFADII